MRKGLFTRLAFTNFKSNRRMYVPYLASCSGTVAMFYMMLFLATNKGLGNMRGGDTLRIVLSFGCIVIGIFAVVILLYANSFLMKQRKRELGLYNILGMGKKHLACLMATETMYTALFSFGLGLGAGLLFSKLLLLLVCKMLGFAVPFGFEVSGIALAVTLLLFAGIFLITLLWNVSRVSLAKPVELLSSASVGEREPKTKWVVTVLGFITLGGGYILALTTKTPSLAVVVFFLAVILVIIGTYCLFTAGSIALLKSLKKSRSYYYSTKHFISVSSMIYRMKQNAMGLANICILSTMVLVMLSTTICLYYGSEDSLRVMYPRNVEVHAIEVNDEMYLRTKELTEDAIASTGCTVTNVISYRFTEFWTSANGMNFTQHGSDDNAVLIEMMPVEDYNAVTGDNAVLAAGEALYYSADYPCTGNEIVLYGISYKIVDCLDDVAFQNNYYRANENTVVYVIVPSVEDMVTMDMTLAEVNSMESDPERFGRYSFYYGIDAANTAEEAALYDAINTALDGYVFSFLEGEGFYLNMNYTGQARDTYYSVYGGLFFLGVFLALMFTCAAALIMYYKQISEGYDDRGRFEIMQKVGLSHAEVKASVRSQVLTVFFLPLIAAGVHVAFAFPLIAVLFRVLALTNVSLFLQCTLGCYAAFAAVYALMYALTARTYYKIVA